MKQFLIILHIPIDLHTIMCYTFIVKEKTIQVRILESYYNKLLEMARPNQKPSGVIMEWIDRFYRPRNNKGHYSNPNEVNSRNAKTKNS